MKSSSDLALEVITNDAPIVVGAEELSKKLKEGQTLRVKFGVDPTAPDIHLGHTVPLMKLREFQLLGHTIVLIIGDFTAQIGDPTGTSKTRPVLKHKEILKNAATFLEQASKILKENNLEVVYNNSWFSKMTLGECVKLNSMVTVQQMLQRTDFADRMVAGTDVRLHELQYPIMQGWDSVMVKADVEIGGTDQLFNMHVGRDLQRSQNMDEQAIICMPILTGLDGKKKMSKSLNNYVGVNDEPFDMYGKLMSIPDDLMIEYYSVLRVEWETEFTNDPLLAKKRLALAIVAKYHGLAAANNCTTRWDARKDLTDSSDLPEFEIKETIGTTIYSAAREIYSQLNITKSGNDVRRLIEQGSVRINGDKITDMLCVPEWEDGQVLKLDKINRVKVVINKENIPV